MDLERQTLCRKLVTFLYSACPKLVLALKATPQVYPGSTSDFHMEDSVWTHTMLVLQAALERTDFGLEDIATALVHDFAKPLTARVTMRSPRGNSQPTVQPLLSATMPWAP